ALYHKLQGLSRTWLGYSQNHLAVAGGYVVDTLDFVNVSEMPAAHPPATASTSHWNSNFDHSNIAPAIANLLLDTQVNRTDRNDAGIVVWTVASFSQL